MFLRPINPQPLVCNLKFSSRKAKTHEAQYPNQDPDRLWITTLHSPDIHGLRVIPEPISEVDFLNEFGGPFCSLQEQKFLESIFDVTMSEVLTFDPGDSGNITSTKGELDVEGGILAKKGTEKAKYLQQEKQRKQYKRERKMRQSCRGQS